MKRALILGALALLALAYFDVQTGVQLLDQTIQAVPIEWLRELVNV